MMIVYSNLAVCISALFKSIVRNTHDDSLLEPSGVVNFITTRLN